MRLAFEMNLAHFIYFLIWKTLLHSMLVLYRYVSLIHPYCVEIEAKIVKQPLSLVFIIENDLNILISTKIRGSVTKKILIAYRLSIKTCS